MSNKKKILIIGAGGGREHAIGWKIAQSDRVGEIFFAKGNAGTAQIGTNLDILPTDISGLIEFVRENNIDVTLAVSDEVLALGVVDEFRKENLRIFGTTREASQLESSKVFAKNFMKKYNLPTAKFETFDNYEKALQYLNTENFPIVIKADGLALGKGVLICKNKEDAQKAIEDILVKKVFGQSGNNIVIEEFLTGIEISTHIFSDGVDYSMFPTSQDHKRIGEGDTGLNTGGMGTVGPLPFVDKEMINRIKKEIVEPTLEAMRNEGLPFEGVLYPGLMITSDGPKILEFNARFGDPETQSYMRLLDTDLLDIVDAVIDKKLNDIEIKWKDLSACTVILASTGYPEAYEKGKIITGINDAEKNRDIVVFHAGAKVDNNNLVTNGGRVLGVSAVGNNLQQALATAYTEISKIYFEGMVYRKDIGKKALNIKHE